MSNFLRGLAVVTLGVLVAAIGWLLFSPDAAPLPVPEDRPVVDSTKSESTPPAAVGAPTPSSSATAADSGAAPPSGFRRIRGRVVDRGGIGIGHAVVRALAQPAGADFELDSLWFTRVPDQPVAADGTFAVVVPIHAPFDLVAEARGFAPGATHLPSRAEGAVEIVMDVPTVIEGTVRAAKGARPVPHAKIAVHMSAYAIERRAVADAEGRFVIDDLRGGSASITVAAPGFGTTEDAVELPEAGRFTFSVDLEPGRTARVQAVDMRTRAPVAGAWIAYGSERWTAGDDGVVVMTDLPRRSFAVEVRKSGYLPSFVRFTLEGVTPDVALEAELRRGRRIVGRVTASDGAPVAGATVSGSRWMPNDEAIREIGVDRLDGVTVSAEDGTYALTTEIDGESRVDVPEGEPATASLFVTARHPAHGNAATRLEVKASATDEETKVDVAFARRASSVRGVVLDRDGVAMGRALVELYAIIHRIDEHEYSEVEVPSAVAVTDAEGRFECVGLAAGFYAARVRVTGYFSKREELPEVAEGAALDDVRLVMERSTELHGRVVDAKGEGVGGAHVVLHSESTGILAHVMSSSSGSFGLRYPSGTEPIAVAFRSMGWKHKSMFVSELATQSDVVLEPDPRFVKVRGKVVDAATRAPIHAASVNFAWEGKPEDFQSVESEYLFGPGPFASTNDQGMFEVVLLKGPWRGQAAHDRFGSTESFHVTADDGAEPLELELKPEARVELAVVAPSGLKDWHAVLVTDDPKCTAPDPDWPDSVGRVVWRVRDPGRYRVIVMMEPRGEKTGVSGSILLGETPWFDVRAGAALARTLKIEEPAHVTIRVGGVPAKTQEEIARDRFIYTITLTRLGELAHGSKGRSDTWTLGAITDDYIGKAELSLGKGESVVLSLPDGRYRILAEFAEFSFTKTIQVAAGKSVDVLFELPVYEPAPSETDPDTPEPPEGDGG